MTDASFSTMGSLPAGPPDAPAVIAFLTRSLGYRYRWATDGMAETTLAFRPVEGSMDMAELMGHLCDLAWWMRATLTGVMAPRPEPGVEGLRAATMAHLEVVAEAFAAMTPADLEALRISPPGMEEAFPLSNVIHGPLADFLTHVGQVTSWRRIAGDLAPAAPVFFGGPPA